MTDFPVSVPDEVRLRLHLAGPGLARATFLELPARARAVETTSALVVVVDAPDLAAVLAPGVRPADSEHTVSWPSGDGQLELPCLLEVAGDQWRLVGNGPTRHVSPRGFVRAQRDLRVSLTGCEPGAPPDEVTGTTLDVSPGGLRCAVDAQPPGVGAAVTVTFHLPEQALAGTGVVVRHESLPDGRIAVAIRFDEPDLVDNALLHADIATFLGTDDSAG